MKKILSIVTIAAMMLIAGCISDGDCTDCTFTNNNGNSCIQTNVTSQAGFNSEEYVWENFVFSTNKVNNTRK